MTLQIPRLSELDLTSGSTAPLKVLVVSSEFLGPVKNGGIGTATSGLIRQLAEDGHATTLLYTLVEGGTPANGDRPWGHWVDKLDSAGIKLEYIPHEGTYREWRAKSWHVKDFLAGHDFDVVYFNDHHGSGYYSLLGKRAGLAPFAGQLHCIITHGSMEWVFDINDQYASRAADIEMMGLERRSVELADVVIGPSRYLLKTYARYGWALPANTLHQPYALYANPNVQAAPGRRQVDELVFFGRLETRKGLWLFCEALDRIAGSLRGKRVTFLGRPSDVSGMSSALQIVNRTAKWPCQVRLLTDYDQERALNYLSKPGRLAVMPSLADNSPCVIYECMEAAIPFVTTLGSGGEELVHPDTWPEVMVRPNVEEVAEKLETVLDRGATLGRPRFDPADNLVTWSAWHAHLSIHRSKYLASAAPFARSVEPMRRGTPQASLFVVVDDGSCQLSLLIENLTRT